MQINIQPVFFDLFFEAEPMSSMNFGTIFTAHGTSYDDAMYCCCCI